MKKFISIFLTAAMCGSLIVSTQAANSENASEQTLVMTINSPAITVNGVSEEIDPGIGTTPVISNGRTILPVRAIIEAFGGNFAWDANTRTATLTYNNNEIELVIDSTAAIVNGESQTLDVSPVIINDITYLPIRFIAESFGWSIDWNAANRTITIVKPAEVDTPAANDTDDEDNIDNTITENETPAQQDETETSEEQDETETSDYVGTNEFDLEKGVVVLNNGLEMPILGIGTFTLSQEQAEESVYNALIDGYHLIDTASAYNNEEGVGRGIERSGVPREEIFVTTKLWPSAYNMEGIDACLEKLGLEYVDLMLLHQPMGDYIEGYKAMEEAVKEGKIKSIGLSNFNREKFEEIMEIATIPPAVLQVETHPYYQQSKMMEYLDKYGTVIEAWFPLGGRGNTQTLFDEETIKEIAEAHNKSSAQIILRWHLQAGHIAIPGSSNPDHIQENIEIFDFELSDEEMEKMSAMETNEPFFKGFGDNNDEAEEAARDAADRWGLNTGDEQ